MTEQSIQIRNIIEPHPAHDTEKVASIQASLSQGGWQGRPLLVLEVGELFQALTGSHRIEAARGAGFEEIPCAVIDAEAFYGAGYEPNDLWDDDERLRILREIGDDEAASLMEQDIATR